jgi:hypothetical protein
VSAEMQGEAAVSLGGADGDGMFQLVPADPAWHDLPGRGALVIIAQALLDDEERTRSVFRAAAASAVPHAFDYLWLPAPVARLGVLARCGFVPLGVPYTTPNGPAGHVLVARRLR